MVCKEELCKWFKNLRPHQRIDYMCGLLHMCLPLELRFLGSVLEDHGKKNYNFLRDAELKANNSAEISKLQSGTDKQLRATVSVYLSLLHSSNTPCAQLLFEVLEKNLERAFTFGADPNDNEEILMALTLAINHPAFQFHQKNILYEHYARFDPGASDRRNKNTEACDLFEEPSSVEAVEARLREQQDSICNVEVKEFSPRKQSGKKFEFKVHVTWSNGSVFELTKTMREMHDFHIRLLRLFPDEVELQKREWKSAFSNHYNHHYHQHKEELARTLTNYISLLVRQSAILKHDQVVEFFKGGNQIQQGQQEQVIPPAPPRVGCGVTLSPMSVTTDGEQMIPPFPLKSLTVCNSQLHPFPQNYLVPIDPRLARCNSADYLPVPNNQRHICPHGVVSHHVDSPSHSSPSSTNGSPLNSRSTSPNQSSDMCMETVQLLKLLNLDQYSDLLGKLTLKQLKSQSSEDLTKAGLPKDAQNNLKSKLETINREKGNPALNGVVDGSSGTLSPASPNNIPWPTAHAPPIVPIPFLTGPIYVTHSPAPVVPPPQPDGVGSDSEVSSAPPSPTQMCNMRQRQKTDSSGSDDNDKDKPNGSEFDNPRTDGKRRLYPNRPGLLPPRSGGPYPEEVKGGLVRQPSPHNVYSDTKPDLAPVATAAMSTHNGYQSDPNPSPGTSSGFAPRHAVFPSILRPYVKPAPAHTNLALHNKNVINMPQEGHVKQQPHMMMYYHAVRQDIPMTTSVMPLNLNNNTVTNQTYSANSEGVSSQRIMQPYNMSLCQRGPMVPLHGPRSVLTNVNSATSVTVSQGGSPQSIPAGHSAGPANLSVKPANGVPVPMPNPSGTPPESVHSGSDSPLQMIHNSQSAASTTITFSTATSTFSAAPQTVSTTTHAQCSSCGCNCNSGTPSSTNYQPQYNVIPPYPYYMQASIYQNGMIPPFSNLPTYGHHVPPPAYPNGLNHEMYVNHPAFPQMHPAMAAPHLVQSLYGNLHHGQGNPGAHVKHKPQGCYNCGSSSHKAQDCKENSMDAMSGHYHLDYKPKSDSD
ncbi:zinc finger CCHC domain-containing protein 2-like isoform X1 [Haliotis rufescens]|uniref:zinc finger CCHC domain-containing protein 2-like isoform X1 n=1 Tax=Haliotis rufescens TaxID=6454 RepID=UPI001EAFF485|nr:zinc finger CCHC domain-containing protein 2-like isoform X1 [Haliotis rufescens]